MSTVLLSNECISWATSAAALPGYDVAYSYHTLSWLLGSDTPPLPHSQLLPCILAGQEDECLLWDELCVGIREGKGQARVCLWSLPNVYAQAMTSMKVWMIVSFAHIPYLWSDEESYVTSIIMTFVLLVGCCIYAWEDVALRLMLMSRKRRKNQIMLAIPGWSFFLSKIPGICLQCAHLHYDWWWKMEEALHQQGRRRCLSPASSCSMTLWARGITEKSHVFWLTKILKRSSAMRLVLL